MNSIGLTYTSFDMSKEGNASVNNNASYPYGNSLLYNLFYINVKIIFKVSSML